jgi:gas vesicle protein
MDKNEKKGLAIGAAIGAVLGVVGGILFAPKSGKETRGDIKNTAVHTAAKVHQETDELLEKAKNLSGKAASSAKKHINEVTHTAENLKEVVKAFKEGKANDKDLDDAINKVKAAQKSLKTFIKK